MASTRTNLLFRLMPSLTDVAFLLPVVFLFSKLNGAKTMLGDGDTGWHVRTGEWILAHRQVPTADFFSFTMPGKPFYAWEWLWDVVFAWLHARWGLEAVVLASLLVICAASVLMFKLALRRSGNPLVAIGLTALAACAASIHWLARPHLFTLLFVLVFLAVLEKARVKGKGPEDGNPLPAVAAQGRAEARLQPEGLPHISRLETEELAHSSRLETEGLARRSRLLWWLPVLMVLWTNLHGGFVAGIIITGAYCGGELLAALLAASAEERHESLRRAVPFGLVTIACAAASLVNPYFYHLHVHIWNYLRDPFQWQYISEFQSANFRTDDAVYLEAMLLMGAGAAVWYARRKRFSQVLLLGGWAQLALTSARNIPIFMMLAAVIVAEPVTEWLNAMSEARIAGFVCSIFKTVREISEEIVPMERPWRVHAVSALAIAGLAFGMAAPGAGQKLKPEYDTKLYPEGALAVIGPQQRVFTHDEWGDYLIYKLSPNGTKVFVDGRSDFYGGKFDQAYIDVMNVKYDWEKTLKSYGVDTILLPVDAALAGALKESRHWRVIYDDGRAIVFRSNQRTTGGFEQVSASTKGGVGVRDLTIAAAGGVRPQGHEKGKEGVNQ